MPAGNLGDPKAEVPRGNQAGREVAWDHFSCQRSRLPRPVVVARYRGTETAGPSAKRGDSLAPRGTSEFREVSRPRGECSVTFAVCAKCSSVLEPTATRSPHSYSATATDMEPTGADIIDMLTMHPKERRKVARLLGEIGSGGRGE